MNLPGAYRKLVAFPADLSWKYVKDAHACTANNSAGHSVAQEDLSPEDRDIKRLRFTVNHSYKDKEEHPTECASKAPEFDKNVQRGSRALSNDVEISFSLEPSCYATSCIRELLKK